MPFPPTSPHLIKPHLGSSWLPWHRRVAFELQTPASLNGLCSLVLHLAGRAACTSRAVVSDQGLLRASLRTALLLSLPLCSPHPRPHCGHHVGGTDQAVQPRGTTNPQPVSVSSRPLADLVSFPRSWFFISNLTSNPPSELVQGFLSR